MAEGLLAYIKGQTMGNTPSPRASELSKYVSEMEGELRYDWTRRVYGDGTYSGYNTLRDFYKGKQWSFRKEGGGTMRTYNYCYTIVENMTAFLTNEAPQISCPPRRVDDPVERALAEGRTKLLQTVHDENALALVFQRAARTASVTGDAFIFGAIPTFRVNDSGEQVFDSIRYWNVERPETIRVIWKDGNYNEIAAFIKHYRISVAVAKRLFKKEIETLGVTIERDYDPENLHPEEDSSIPMVTIKEFWDDKEYVLMFNGDNKPIHYVEHKWGFIPLQYVPNIHLPGEPKGTSDIEHELDPQQEYNERASDFADIIKEVARPSYWGKNLDNLSEVRSGQTVIYQTGEDGEINAMPKSANLQGLETYIADRKNDIINLSGMNQVLYPGNSVLQATGRALSVVMQGVNNKISLRKEWWSFAFKQLNKSILFHCENHVQDADLLIDGYYKTDVFISSVLMRSVTDEINKFQAKVQSLTTTQLNVGIPNPSEEQKLMKEELQDEILATEIAKQPGLLHQILAERVAQMNGAGGMSAANQAGINGQPSPMAGEGDNVEGDNPTPAGGVASPTSPEGAIKQQASRRGAARTVPAPAGKK